MLMCHAGHLPYINTFISPNKRYQLGARHAYTQVSKVALWLKKKKNPLTSVGNEGLIPGSGRSLGEGNGNPLQYSCLGKPMDKGAWRAIVQGVAKESDTT